MGKTGDSDFEANLGNDINEEVCDDEGCDEEEYFDIDLTDEQEYVLAMNAVLTESNEQSHYHLHGEFDEEHGRILGTNTLRKFWDIDSAESLRETITWLMTEGHRIGYERLYAAGELPEDYPPSILAWDLCRLMSIARWGAAAGYIHDEEAWTWLYTCGRQLELAFNSFSEIGANFIAGHRYWADGSVNKSIAEAFDYLADEENEDSVWNEVEWGYYY